MGTFTTNYRRKYYPKPRFAGTRYRSNRKVTGVYRSGSRTIVSGAAKRRYGRQMVLKALRSVAEHKYHDVIYQFDGTDGYVSSTSLVLRLSEVPQGSTDVERIGDKLTMTSLEFRFTSYPIVDIKTNDTSTYRITVFLWKDDTVPSVYNIYESSGGAGAIDQFPGCWPFTHDTAIKRKILYDKTISTVGASTATQIVGCDNKTFQQHTVIIPLYKMKKNTIWFENGSLNGVNKIYAIITGDVPLANIPSVTIPHYVYIWSRLNFIDV